MGSIRDKFELNRKVIRVPKEHSAFLYFQLEANEGLSLYSTLDHEKGQLYRDIEIISPMNFINETNHLLETLKSTCQWEMIEETQYLDGPTSS